MRTFIKGAKFEAPGVFASLFTFLIAFLLYILTKSVAWTLVVAIVSALVLNCACFRRWFRRTVAIVAVLILAVMIGFNHYNKYMKDVPQDTPIVDTVPEKPDNNEKKDEEDLDVEPQDVIQTPYSNGSARGGNGGATKTKPTVKPSYSNTGKSEFKVTTNTDPNTDNPNNTFGGNSVDFDKKNKEEGYEKVATGEDGVTAWVIPDDEDEDKKDDENSNLKPSFSEEDASSAKDVPATTIPTPKPSNEVKKTAADVSQVMVFDEEDKVNNAKVSDKDTSKDVDQSDKVSDTLTQLKKEDPKDTPKEENNTTTIISQPNEDIDLVKGNSDKINVIEKGDSEEVNKPQEPVIKAELKMTALDGNSVYAGDTVQFKVSGDVKSVEGLDGVDYVLGNGYLSIQTNPNEATVLTPTLVAEDGTTVSQTVTVNVLNFNN